MSLIAKDSSQGQDFEPIPAGLQHGICYSIIDIGTQPQVGKWPARRKVVFSWELPNETIELVRDGVKVTVPRAISAKHTLTLASKGTMRPMLESWRGRAFTAEELEGFDLANALGANCFLNVVHDNGKGDKANRIYANVKSVNPLPKGMPKINPTNPKLIFSMDDVKNGAEIPANIPDWIKALIIQSDEYIIMQQKPGTPQPAEEHKEELDDSIPF